MTSIRQASIIVVIVIARAITMNMIMHVVMVLGSLPTRHNRRRTINIWAIPPTHWAGNIGGAKTGEEIITRVKGTIPSPNKTSTRMGTPRVGRGERAETMGLR